MPQSATTQKISVALATYNGSRFVWPLLESISQQTRRPDQIVVSDDCSSDNTLQIVAQFRKKSKLDVKVINNTRQQGVLENFYTAFNACDHGLIAYSDQDDVWIPEKLERAMKVMSISGTSLVVHPSFVVGGDLEDIGARTAPRNSIYGRLRFPVDPNSVAAFGHQMVFTREVLLLMNALRRHIVAAQFKNNFDRYIPLCATLLGDVVVLREPLVRFRRHSGALTNAGMDGADPRPNRFKQQAKASADFYSGHLSTCRVAIDAGLISAPAGERIIAALKRKERIATLHCSILESPDLLSRITYATRAFGISILKPSGFSNGRQGRDAALSLVLLAEL